MTKYEALMVEVEKLRAAGRRARDHQESQRLMDRAAALEKKARDLSISEACEEDGE